MLENLTLLHVFLLALGTHRLARLIIEDAILETPREALFKRFPPETTRIGYLLTCYWCLSIWIALIFVLCYILVPTATLVAALILTISSVTGLLSER